MFTATKPDISYLLITVLFWQLGSVTTFTDYFKVVPKLRHSHNTKFTTLTNLLGQTFGSKFVSTSNTFISATHERQACVTAHTHLQDSLLLLQACPMMAFVKYVFVFAAATVNILEQGYNILGGIKH
jgi:hypothetical protein